MAERVQLSRTKGWRMPANTVKVDRSTRWGNPFKPIEGIHTMSGLAPRTWCVHLFRKQLERGYFRARVTGQGTMTVTVDDIQRELRGKNLACWCPLDHPCHADVLLEIANADMEIAECPQKASPGTDWLLRLS